MMNDVLERALRKEIRDLRDECSLLTEQVIQLKDLLKPGNWAPPTWLNLTPSETTILGFLAVAQGYVSSARLNDLLYSMRTDKDVPLGNCVQVFITRIRTKGKDAGIRIINRHGVGYKLVEDSLEIVRGWSKP